MMKHHASCDCKHPTCLPQRPTNLLPWESIQNCCNYSGPVVSIKEWQQAQCTLKASGFHTAWARLCWEVSGKGWEAPDAEWTICLAYAPCLLPKGLSSAEQEGAEIPPHAIISALGTRHSSDFNFSLLLLLLSDVDLAHQTDPTVVSTEPPAGQGENTGHRTMVQRGPAPAPARSWPRGTESGVPKSTSSHCKNLCLC